jgi:hypothetical protein
MFPVPPLLNDHSYELAEPVIFKLPGDVPLQTTDEPENANVGFAEPNTVTVVVVSADGHILTLFTL